MTMSVRGIHYGPPYQKLVHRVGYKGVTKIVKRIGGTYAVYRGSLYAGSIRERDIWKIEE